MKKFAFTLAEVLITLTIVGIVAALTMPALISSVGNAKIGPTLAKAVSTFVTANEMMLTQAEVSSIDPGIMGSSTNWPTSDAAAQKKYWDSLSSYMKISFPYSGKAVSVDYSDYSSSAKYNPSGDWGGISNMSFSYGYNNSATVSGCMTEDGVMYYFYVMAKLPVYETRPSHATVGILYIDINGISKPNKIGKDLFRFMVFNDGSVIPYGSASSILSNAMASNLPTWRDGNCDSAGVKIPDTCAGSIFENNRKVIYQ